MQQRRQKDCASANSAAANASGTSSLTRDGAEQFAAVIDTAAANSTSDNSAVVGSTATRSAVPDSTVANPSTVDSTVGNPAVADPVTSPQAIAEPEIRFFAEHFDEIATEVAPLKGRVGKNPKTAAVILAGGQGERFGMPGGKQLAQIFGKPLLTWSAESFDAVADVGLIIVVCPENRALEYCRRAIDPYPFVTPIEFAPAGELRQESSFSGVMRVPDSYELIAIHDGARPLVTPELIMHAISAVKGNVDVDGAVVGHPAIDTLKVVSDGVIVGTPDREAFWVAQTPQVFRAGIIREGHKAALSDGFVGTDDSSLVERIGGAVTFVQSPRDNIKVTVPEDYGPAEAALAARISKRADIK